MMGLIRDMLRTPDAQADPYTWATVLLAHAMIGVVLATLLPGWLVIAGYALWEAVQWRRYNAGAWDCLLDWSAVSLGVSVAVALSEGHGAGGAALAMTAVLLAGVTARMRE